ncbi:MAG: hypothetical protein ACKO2D_03220, partial [Chloroflexota bacterium]
MFPPAGWRSPDRGRGGQDARGPLVSVASTSRPSVAYTSWPSVAYTSWPSVAYTSWRSGGLHPARVHVT